MLYISFSIFAIVNSPTYAKPINFLPPNTIPPFSLLIMYSSLSDINMPCLPQRSFRPQMNANYATVDTFIPFRETVWL